MNNASNNANENKIKMIFFSHLVKKFNDIKFCLFVDGEQPMFIICDKKHLNPSHS
jgi:hypothetical protein